MLLFQSLGLGISVSGHVVLGSQLSAEPLRRSRRYSAFFLFIGVFVGRSVEVSVPG